MSCRAQIVKRKALLWSGAAFLLSLSDGAAVSSSSSVVLTSPPSLEWRCFTDPPSLGWCFFPTSCFRAVLLFLFLLFGWCWGFLLLLGGVEVSSSSWVVLLSPPLLWVVRRFLLLLWVVLISSLLTTALFSFQCYIDTLRAWHDMFRISWLSENTFYLNRWKVNWILSDRMN